MAWTLETSRVSIMAGGANTVPVTSHIEVQVGAGKPLITSLWVEDQRCSGQVLVQGTGPVRYTWDVWNPNPTPAPDVHIQVLYYVEGADPELLEEYLYYLEPGGGLGLPSNREFVVLRSGRMVLEVRWQEGYVECGVDVIQLWKQLTLVLEADGATCPQGQVVRKGSPLQVRYMVYNNGPGAVHNVRMLLRYGVALLRVSHVKELAAEELTRWYWYKIPPAQVARGNVPSLLVQSDEATDDCLMFIRIADQPPGPV